MLMKILILYFLLLVHDTQNDKSAEIVQAIRAIETITMIVKKGTDVTVECHLCDVHQLKWTYKPFNGTHEDIVENNNIIRDKNNRINGPWFNLKNNSNCTYNLFLPNIQFEVFGFLSCWEGLVEKRITHVVVINSSDTCSVEPNVSDSVNILLKQNDSVTIKCSFQYSADESCIVAPIWTDLTGYRNLTIPGDDFEVNMDDKYAWIHFKPDADLTNGTRFNLSFAFNCSFSNNSQDKHIRHQSRYEFDNVPFTFLVENKKVEKDDTNNHGMINLNFLLTVGISMIIAIMAVVLLFDFIWKIYKQNCANNRRRTNNETESEIQMGDKYLGIREDLRSKDIRIYEDIIDNIYETVDDPLEPVHGGNYTHIVDH